MSDIESKSESHKSKSELRRASPSHTRGSRQDRRRKTLWYPQSWASPLERRIAWPAFSSSPTSSCKCSACEQTQTSRSFLFGAVHDTYKVALNHACHPRTGSDDAPCYRARTGGGFQRAQPAIDFSRRSDSIPAVCFGINISNDIFDTFLDEASPPFH